ncbi:biosynthetic arginine decarboxylase [Nitratifractor salsuginis]|uniref:Arginine decarboxylase n=1 Tax=Nitratifractor salsuginis (strain DSM 16511 / JCM 12458 / E9I37-1) TaxID=749222 RepID=E6WXP1_NITSE|nr:biosynthetic arginine decarboxylase [Nitratifractor salsuginis]ADV46298.1 arginine decarboxylase [Nitratifractor salsuginis DSM 16511]
MKNDYGLSIWGDGNFLIDGETVNVNHGLSPSLLEITRHIREQGYKGPLLLRFPHLIRKQIDTLFGAFERARREFKYSGKFHAVFPLKVNQYPNFVESLIEVSGRRRYGLEAGSKAELIIAMAKTPLGAPITVNGFKDKEMIALAFIAAKSGHNITLTIEGINELETIIEVHRECNRDASAPITPKIGMRIRLHSTGVGIWAKSGGYSSKFGLTSTELLEAYEMLRQEDLIGSLAMIHFHIGSQMSEIGPLKKALREAGNIYAELKRRGAENLHAINIGGGLAVEYSQHQPSRNYSIKEFANDVVFAMQEIARQKGVEEPDIFTESGRFIAAPHAVLVAPVLELFSQEYHERSLRLKPEGQNPPLVQELYDLYRSLKRTNAREYLHDALDHMESLLTLFDLGYIDLEDRSNTEILVNLIVKKTVTLLERENSDELKRLQNRIQEKYLVNFSIFQSLPDFWGLGQHFPIMPLHRLDQRPSRPASIWDITCDSDGEIPFDPDAPLLLHDIDVEEEEYFLGIFLTGAYQEVLGMRHNLFTHPTEAVIEFDEEGEWSVTGIIEAQNLMDILEDLDYDLGQIDKSLKTQIEDSEHLNETEKQAVLGKLYLYLSENSYLKTIQSRLGGE